MPSMEALPVNPNKPQEEGGDEEGKLNINTNNNLLPNTIITTENIPKDHTIEAAQQVFEEMPECLTTKIEETPAIATEILITTTTEIVSEEQIIEEGNGVAEGITTTRIEETLASNSIITTEVVVKKQDDHGAVDGTPEVVITRNEEEGITEADQVFDEMSEQITSLNAAAAAVDDADASAIVSEIVLKEGVIVEQQVFDEMSERLTSQNNETAATVSPNEITPKAQTTEEQDGFDGMSEGDVSEEEDDDDYDEEEQTPRPFAGSEEEEDEDGKSSNKRKRKSLSSLIPEVAEAMSVDSLGGLETLVATPTATFKKSKKKKDCVWTKSTSRKGKKKGKLNSSNGAAVEDTVLIVPVARFPDRSDDSADMKICLSKMYKAEKVELSEDRLSAGSSKGYRMVRATRGVVEGAWYFEIKVSKLGETGHTRLGWSMEKGDLQAPVGYDANSFGYRDIDGSKVHKATREKYGDAGYVEGDTIGFYINLPNGAKYAPKPPQFVWYKGQKYMCAADGKEEAPKVVPGSEICFFKNGVCQGVAFKDLYGGRYYPAASMYTQPNQPNCVVKFNFGPDFECFPQDFDSHPLPMPVIEVPYLGFDGGAENGVFDEKKC